jgi:hypothetical protein
VTKLTLKESVALRFYGLWLLVAPKSGAGALADVVIRVNDRLEKDKDRRRAA